MHTHRHAHMHTRTRAQDTLTVAHVSWMHSPQARFKQVDGVQTSVTILDDLMPLLPIIAERRTVGVLNFTNPGTISYPDIVRALAAPVGPHNDGYS